MDPIEPARRTRRIQAQAVGVADALTMVPRPRVPPEIWRMILLECFEDKALLGQWCLVSLETLQVAGPLLYEDVRPRWPRSRGWKQVERERRDLLKELFQLKVRAHLLPLPSARPIRN
jgi:hypothetical protein